SSRAPATSSTARATGSRTANSPPRAASFAPRSTWRDAARGRSRGRASDSQARAEAAYQETRYLAALQLTLSARERAMRALTQCNAGESLDDTVDSALQRTADVLARAHELVGPDAGDRPRQQLANAENLQARARG